MAEEAEAPASQDRPLVIATLMLAVAVVLIYTVNALRARRAAVPAVTTEAVNAKV